MSTPLLAGVHPSSCTSRPSSTCTSPVITDCSTLLRSLWTDLSSDVCAVSSSITSWLSSWTGSVTCCGLSCGVCHISRPHRLSIDDYFHWLRHHRSSWLHLITRPQHQRRRGTYLLHDDESDDEREDDEREETLVMSYQDYTRKMEQQRQAYVPQTCLCQRDACQNNTCRNTTLMLAACAGLYERASLRHPEFVAPRHLGVATDDVVVVPPMTPLPSTTSACESSEFLSVPSSPHLSSQWSDDDSDVDMSRSSSPIPSPLSYPTRMDSDEHVSIDMVDSESDVESEQDGELVDADMDPSIHKSSKSSALRRRSSTQAWLLPGMARSRSLQRLALDTPSTTSPMTSCGLKTRRLVSSTPSTPKDVMDQLWSIQDSTQLESMKQSFRDMHISSNVCAV